MIPDEEEEKLIDNGKEYVKHLNLLHLKNSKRYLYLIVEYSGNLKKKIKTKKKI